MSYEDMLINEMEEKQKQFAEMMDILDESEKIAGEPEPENQANAYNYVNPRHYKDFFGWEVIDLIERVLTPEQFKGFLFGTYMRYAARAGSKPGEPANRDLDKMKLYKEKYRQFMNQEQQG